MFDIKQHDSTAPAPGELELVQRFMNLHEHVPGLHGDQPPSTEMFRTDRKSTRLNSSHSRASRMPSSA